MRIDLSIPPKEFIENLKQLNPPFEEISEKSEQNWILNAESSFLIAVAYLKLMLWPEAVKKFTLAFSSIYNIKSLDFSKCWDSMKLGTSLAIETHLNEMNWSAAKKSTHIFLRFFLLNFELLNKGKGCNFSMFNRRQFEVFYENYLKKHKDIFPGAEICITIYRVIFIFFSLESQPKSSSDLIDSVLEARLYFPDQDLCDALNLLCDAFEVILRNPKQNCFNEELKKRLIEDKYLEEIKEKVAILKNKVNPDADFRSLCNLNLEDFRDMMHKKDIEIESLTKENEALEKGLQLKRAPEEIGLLAVTSNIEGKKIKLSNHPSGVFVEQKFESPDYFSKELPPSSVDPGRP